MIIKQFLGCRSAAVNLEARSLSGWGTSRHCVVAKLQDLSVDQFRDIRAKAGALLIVLPREISGLSAEEKQVRREINYIILCIQQKIYSDKTKHFDKQKISAQQNSVGKNAK